MVGRGGIYNSPCGDLYGDGKEVNPVRCKHKWSDWEIVGRTGDWFHPHIVKRFCQMCRETQTDEQ